MNVYQVIYWACSYQHVSIVVAKNEHDAEELITKDFIPDDNYELDIINDIDLTSEEVIHTEVIL